MYLERLVASQIVILQVHNLFITKINQLSSTLPSSNLSMFTEEDGMIKTEMTHINDEDRNEILNKKNC